MQATRLPESSVVAVFPGSPPASPLLFNVALSKPQPGQASTNQQHPHFRPPAILFPASPTAALFTSQLALVFPAPSTHYENLLNFFLRSSQCVAHIFLIRISSSVRKNSCGWRNIAWKIKKDYATKAASASHARNDKEKSERNASGIKSQLEQKTFFFSSRFSVCVIPSKGTPTALFSVSHP